MLSRKLKSVYFLLSSGSLSLSARFSADVVGYTTLLYANSSKYRTISGDISSTSLLSCMYGNGINCYIVCCLLLRVLLVCGCSSNSFSGICEKHLLQPPILPSIYRTLQFLFALKKRNARNFRLYLLDLDHESKCQLYCDSNKKVLGSEKAGWK